MPSLLNNFLSYWSGEAKCSRWREEHAQRQRWEQQQRGLLLKTAGAQRWSLRLWREDEKGSEKTREEDKVRNRKGHAKEVGLCLLGIGEPFMGCQWKSDRVRVLF